jgi:hypothetical protein
MNLRTKMGLKLAAAAIFAALLVAMTLNVAVDFWTPQAELNEPPKVALAPAIEPTAIQIPPATQPLPPEQPTAVQPPWNQPLFEPKFDGPGAARSGPQGGSAGFTAPDFSNALNQYAPLGQVLPPSVSMPGADSVPVIRPIIGGKSGGVESGVMGTAGSLSGTAGGAVGGATSGAGSLLNKR